MFIVSVDSENCVGCGECAKSCPAQLFVLDSGKAEVGDGECMGCQTCTIVCPVGVITVQEY